MQVVKLAEHKIELWAQQPSVFSGSEIQSIIDYGKTQRAEDGIVNNAGGEVKYASRTCKTAWLYPNTDTNWIFDRIVGIIDNINKSHFNFDLSYFEPLQFTSYDSSRQEFYGRHTDCTFGVPHKTASRKLSITLQLSDAIDYQGGDLLLYAGSQPIVAPKALGQLVCFPSYVVHEVTPVTQGLRYSLVTWVHGPLFR